jgi:hypothetical protein
LWVGQRLDRGGSRPGLDQRHFAKNFALVQRVDAPGVGALTDDDFDRSGNDEECCIARVSRGDDRVSGFERYRLHEGLQ